MKTRNQFACQQCGYVSTKWVGRCPACQQWNSLVEETVERGSAPSALAQSTGSAPIPFDEIRLEQVSRTSSGIEEFDRVLGGGIVPGALVLLGGDPGVGKSTLMLEVAVRLATTKPVMYASGEESAQQIKMRGERMGFEPRQLHVFAEMCVERVLEAAEALAVEALVIDSIQTTFTEKLEMAPGSIGQVRQVAAQLLFWSKKRGVPVFVIGHITKDGSIAGPKALEHIVDTVLYFEGPRQHPHRIVRSIKNRFGAANELGIFEMFAGGLKPVEKPSALFLSESRGMGPGSVVLCCVEGSRPLLVEIQALVSRTHFGTPRRLATGVDPQRLSLLCAVIEKRMGVHLWDQDIYVNVAGGLQVEETAADLAVVAAILSSFSNRPIPRSTVVFGEVGLAGEVRPVLFPELRLKESAALGFNNVVLPDQTLSESPAGLATTQIRNLQSLGDLLA